MDGETCERWVAGDDVDTGPAKGRLRKDDKTVRFVELTVNGPKTWSVAAALHPEIAEAYDAAQMAAAEEIISWVAAHATTRVGPRDRQVQVPVEGIEAAVVRHFTSRAGDPHRHTGASLLSNYSAINESRSVEPPRAPAHSGRVSTSRNSWLTNRSSRPTLTSLRSPASTRACSHVDAV